MKLSNKVALITGGGRGIGAACAHLFAKEGAAVVIGSRTESELQRTAEQIRAENPNAVLQCYQLDVSDESSVKNMFVETIKSFGKIDILINNAAIAPVVEIENMDPKTWDQTMAINLRGPFLCSKEAFKVMKQKGGTIVNISSLAGIQGPEKFSGFGAYSASKCGLIGLTEVLAVEGKPFNIKVNAVAPGAIDTEMLHKAAPFLKTDAKPVDVAQVVLFLCQDVESKLVQGTTIQLHSNNA